MSPTDGVGGCVVQSVVTEVEDSLPPLPLTRDALIKAQRRDPSLVKCFEAVNDSEFCGSQSFMIQDAMLMKIRNGALYTKLLFLLVLSNMYQSWHISTCGLLI